MKSETSLVLPIAALFFAGPALATQGTARHLRDVSANWGIWAGVV